MSMAWSLESRVPLADPRVVTMGLRIPGEFKLRNGASKWILRESLRGVVPDWVIDRRKAGFDTPALRWMRTQHAEFMRDLLLGRQARERGWWNPVAVERLLAEPLSSTWFDRVWKLACIEAWGRTVIDRGHPSAREHRTPA